MNKFIFWSLLVVLGKSLCFGNFNLSRKFLHFEIVVEEVVSIYIRIIFKIENTERIVGCFLREQSCSLVLYELTIISNNFFPILHF